MINNGDGASLVGDENFLKLGLDSIGSCITHTYYKNTERTHRTIYLRKVNLGIRITSPLSYYKN